MAYLCYSLNSATSTKVFVNLVIMSEYMYLYGYIRFFTIGGTSVLSARREKHTTLPKPKLNIYPSGQFAYNLFNNIIIFKQQKKCLLLYLL